MKSQFLTFLGYRLTKVSYFVLSTVISPIIFIELLWKFKNNKKFFTEILNRFFGILIKIDNIDLYRKAKKRVWIHAVSVGETHAAIPLIRELLSRDNECNILLSNTTISGFNFFKKFVIKDKLLAERVTHCFFPVDFVWSAKFFLNSTIPQIAIFIETEIWPNFINELSRRNIKIVLANGRLSKKSFKNFKNFSWLSKPTIERFSLILVQSESDEKRFLELTNQVKISVTGNIKFDSFVSKEMIKKGHEWRNLFFKKIFWLALSTRNNEEKKIFEVWSKNKPKNAILIVVPRHPERFNWVYEQAKKVGFTVTRRSHFDRDFNSSFFLKTDVIVGDSMGEITAYARFADLALIGGSVINCGGQSPIELCSQGCPVFFGPHMSNFSSISKQLKLTRAGFEVDSYETWISYGLKLLSNNEKFINSKKEASKFVTKNKGASSFTAKKIEQLI